jgi:excisionase family DNA binding protein
MPDLLTAKEIQTLLQVDRSSIYRMAESGRLPAIKVGKQWRFRADQLESWLKTQTATPSAVSTATNNGLALDYPGALFPLECIQLIQDGFAEVLRVSLAVADLDGEPITHPTHPGSLYQLLASSRNGVAAWRQHIRQLGQLPALEPRFVPGLAGLLSARALVRVGNELKAMVVVFGVADSGWQPAPQLAAELAEEWNVSPGQVQTALHAAPRLALEDQRKVLLTSQRIADILAHIGSERLHLLSRLADIARLSNVR